MPSPGLERFATFTDVRTALATWQHVLVQLEAGEMPPKEKTQPTQEKRGYRRLLTDDEARSLRAFYRQLREIRGEEQH